MVKLQSDGSRKILTFTEKEVPVFDDAGESEGTEGGTKGKKLAKFYSKQGKSGVEENVRWFAPTKGAVKDVLEKEFGYVF